MSKASTIGSYHSPHTVLNGKNMCVGGDFLLRLSPLEFQSYYRYFPLKRAYNFEFEDFFFNVKDNSIMG